MKDAMGIDAPNFANWDTFTNDQLNGMLITWRWIKRQPRWAFWHKEADRFIGEIEAEITSRASIPA
jgi:hypothetical protein